MRKLGITHASAVSSKNQSSVIYMPGFCHIGFLTTKDNAVTMIDATKCIIVPKMMIMVHPKLGCTITDVIQIMHLYSYLYVGTTKNTSQTSYLTLTS